MSAALAFFWFRRDLRLHDNAGLYHALKNGAAVQPVFIFDSAILGKLENKQDLRLIFIHRQLVRLNNELKKHGSALLVYSGKPLDVWKKITSEYSVKSVFTNHDYEPYAIQRDDEIKIFLNQQGISFNTFNDQVVFEKDEVVKDDGSPYTVFTPFMKKWRSKITSTSFESFKTEKHFDHLNKTVEKRIPSLDEIGFIDFDFSFPSSSLNLDLVKNYEQTRDIPSLKGTSRLSVHLRFGTVSIRELFRAAWNVSEKWSNELIWREFYMYILWHFPHVEKNAFREKYNRLRWRTDETDFQKWCEGKTGYPIVDAGMRELRSTGFMHNRVRMITSMFLTKYLLIDWRWGEAWFAQHLLDFELASNNGGWQWSAGTGVDAAPYFRIFSMDEQTRKFDPEQLYIRKWIPEFGTKDYPEPMIDYSFARKRCLDFFKSIGNL